MKNEVTEKKLKSFSAKQNRLSEAIFYNNIKIIGHGL